LSKNHMANQFYVRGMPTDFRYEPQSSANGNLAGRQEYHAGASCGANSAAYARGLDVWQTWYDARNQAVPQLAPGSDFRVRSKITADHGGQAWMMIACGTEISEDVNWTILERSEFDRSNNFLPSHPGVYAWKERTRAEVDAYYHVPSSFSCPSEMAVGRWLWKTGNSCNDINNVGRNTERLTPSEVSRWGKDLGACERNPETFISCFDFKGTWTTRLLGAQIGRISRRGPAQLPSVCPSATRTGPDSDGDCMCSSGQTCYEMGSAGCTFSQTATHGVKSRRWFGPSCSECQCQ